MDLSSLLQVMTSGALSEGLIYGIMVLAVFITFRVLDFPDMTVDGSFPLGAAVMASMVTAGYNPLVAMGVAFLAGAAAGCITAAIHNFLKVPNLLSGILTMTMLWSINIRIMGDRSNLNLLRKETLLSGVKDLGQTWGLPPEISTVIFLALIVFGIKLLLDLFFRTDLGITMGAMGNNPQMIISTGVNPATIKFIGLGLSNGMVALSGAMAAQYQGFADVSLGQGIIVAGLASVMIGEFVLKSNRIFVLTLRVLLGSIIFRALMILARYFGGDLGFKPNDMRLLTGITIIILLVVTFLRSDKGKAKAALQALGIRTDDSKPDEVKTQAGKGKETL